MITYLHKHITAVLFSAFSLLFSSGAHAQYFPSERQQQTRTQENENLKFKDKLRYGGNVGAMFGNVVTFVELSPRIYYLPSEKQLIGIGPNYVYINQRSFNNFPGFSTSAYGGSVMGMQRVFPGLGAMAEVEPVSFERLAISGNELERVFHTNVYVGGVIWQQSGRGNYFLMFLYNINHLSRSFYQPSPLVMRFGFGL